ncbi:MAG: 3-deoxy-7-phosphoheptulonate synthase [Anaerolineaceae bacterium]|nr:3-deoxy-7-phosphoheptulonate synthase [Anaerolineaceae bacterium]
MKVGATQQEVDHVIERIQASGLQAHLVQGEERVIIGAIGDTKVARPDNFNLLPAVDRVMPISRPYKLASREFNPYDTRVVVNGIQIGGPGITLMAGPCSVESREQLLETALAVKEAGAQILRGGAYKPRTSPYAFQGMGEAGLELLAEVREITGMPVITEVMTPEQLPIVEKYADILQIGARNMQNFALLHAAGSSPLPVLLKRGLSATIDELLMSAEHILAYGNPQVILCERGIRTFETTTRNTTDINAIPVLKSMSHLPVILDPSHSTGHWEYVSAVARAGIAAGADGLIVEVHRAPDEALSDGNQSLKPERFGEMVRQVRAIAEVLGRGASQAVSAPSPISLPVEA